MKIFYFVLSSLLIGCGGYDGPVYTRTTQGVTVTATVPSAQETIADIIRREEENPTPPRGDWVAPDHRIRRN